MARLTGTSRKTWVVSLVGQWISSVATVSALPRPMCCSSGLPPKLLPDETWRWTVSGSRPGGHGLDAGADRRAVRLLPDQLHRQPVVSLAGVLEQDVVVRVAGQRAAHLDEDVHGPVAVPVAAGHAVALLQVAGAGGGGDVGEALAADVLEHAVGDQRGEVGSPVPR